MGPAEENILTGGGRYLYVDYVLSGDGTIRDVVWFRVVGNVEGDNKDGGKNARRIPLEDHGEEGADNYEWDAGDTGDQIGVESG